MCENRELRRILGPNREEVTGDGRKWQNTELQNLYSSPNIFRIIKSRGMRWVGYARDEKCIHSLVKNSEGKRQIGTLRHRLEDNIKMDLKEIGWRLGLDSVGSQQEPVIGPCEHDNEPSTTNQRMEVAEYEGDHSPTSVVHSVTVK